MRNLKFKRRQQDDYSTELKVITKLGLQWGFTFAFTNQPISTQFYFRLVFLHFDWLINERKRKNREQIPIVN